MDAEIRRVTGERALRAVAGRRAVAVLASSLLVGVATPAVADGPPAGGCPQPFTEAAVTDYGPGFQDFLATTDRNGDGRVCTKLLPEALPFPNINFVDNVVRP